MTSAEFKSLKRKRPSIRVPAKSEMSGVEAEYERMLKLEFPTSKILYERFTLRLPGGSAYTPDFTIWAANMLFRVVEVKGPYRLKSAGRSHIVFIECIAAFPNITFRFAQKTPDGWEVHEYKHAK